MITPYLQVNGGAWQSINSTNVSSGATVNLGPQPLTGGTWSWTGPNGFSSVSREIDGIPLSVGSNTFVATDTNPGGCKSSVTYTITVTAPNTPTPTYTNSPVPSTATFTFTATRTNTPVPPTATHTNTPVPQTTTPTATPTSTQTSLPPTATLTLTPMSTSTPTRTNTIVPVTATSTNTPTFTLVVTLTPTLTTVSGTVVIQAENACGFTGTVDTNHLGYNGTGFVNLTNNNTAGITFALNATTAQNLTITFRYSNGTTTARPMLLNSISPTASSAVTVNFAPTTNWDSWATITAIVALVPGNNHIQLVPTSTNNNGGPNLDEISFTSSTVTNGNCAAAAAAMLLAKSNTNPKTSTLDLSGGTDPTTRETHPPVVVAPNVSRNGNPIRFQVFLSQPAKILLNLYALTGEQVYQAAIQGVAGENQLTWNLLNRAGSTVSSGLYIYVIQKDNGSGGVQLTGKVTVLH